MVAHVPTLDDVRAERARRSLLAFTQWTYPGYRANWHHVALCRELDAFARREVTRLAVFMPSQNGKSELVSRRLPAFLLGRDPDLCLVACSYSADLASSMNRDVQRIIESEAYGQLFPGTRMAADNARTVSGRSLRNSDLFEIVGHRGVYKSAGIGGSLAGRSADVAIIDDPVKNQEEAHSATMREKVWSWYTGVLRQRLTSDRGRILITMTRWHEDDLSGRVLDLAGTDPKADQWRVVTFPAIADGINQHPDDRRSIGEPLWPARYPLEELERRRLASGSYEWSAMYQQRPVPAGGGMFKREWFAAILEAAPADAEVTARCRFWDCGGTAGGGDYTVGTRLARTRGGLFVVEDVVRGQWSAGDVDRIIRQTALTDGLTVRVREEQEPGSAGKAVIAARTRLLAGFDYRGIPATGEKSLRWRPFAAQAEAGNVRLLRRPWVREWLDELCTVPHGKHDDQADSAAGAFAELALGGGQMQEVRIG